MRSFFIISAVCLLTGIICPAQEIPATAPVNGTINVSSTPENAAISINGEYTGTAPLVGIALTPGHYEIGATLAGYMPLTVNIEVVGGTMRDIDFLLQPERYKKADGGRTRLTGFIFGFFVIALGTLISFS
jgi:hypothetical protein